MLSIRPAIAEHSLHLFGRSIHPELFQVFRTKHIQRTKYAARIDITADGHVITFVRNHSVLSEVVCSRNQILPQRRRIAASAIRGKYHQSIDRQSTIRYTTECERETVSPDLFWMVQSQLQRSDCENELLHVFQSSGRIAYGAVSFLHVEERDSHLLIQAFHTFPDDHTILKSVSSFYAS
ncbi:MAG: DUF2617 family protein [Pirellula sp.]